MAAQDRADRQAAAKAQLNNTRAPGVSTSATLGYHVDHVAQNVSKTVAQQEGESRTLGNIDRSAQKNSWIMHGCSTAARKSDAH